MKNGIEVFPDDPDLVVKLSRLFMTNYNSKGVLLTCLRMETEIWCAVRYTFSIFILA
jgi:hypothetical protein